MIWLFQSAVFPGGQEGKWCPGLYQRGQQEQGGDRAPVLSTGEAAPGVLCSVLGLSLQEGRQGAGAALMILWLSHFQERLLVNTN